MSDAPAVDPDADRWLRLTLDPQRLAVLGQLAGAPATAAEISDAVGLSHRQVLSLLATMTAHGFVQRDDARYRLDLDRLRRVAAGMPREAQVDRSVLMGMTADEGAVLARFFTGNRLTQIPLAHGKRRVVLERLSLDFEPGVTYPESAVNEILSARHADYASLRRYLVDEGYLERRDGRYWRSGGRVDTIERAT